MPRFHTSEDMKTIIDELHSMRQSLNDLKTDMAVVKNQVTTLNKQVEENHDDMKNLKWNITAFVTPIAVAVGQVVQIFISNKP